MIQIMWTVNGEKMKKYEIKVTSKEINYKCFIFLRSIRGSRQYLNEYIETQSLKFGVFCDKCFKTVNSPMGCKVL